MDPILARYPFLEAAREAVTESGSSLETVLGGDGRSAALDRALERVHHAIAGETVGEPRRDDEVELLSYPLARIIVSLVDDNRVTNRYVRAEGRSAIDRVADDGERPRRTADGLTVDDLLDEFGLETRETSEGHAIGVLDYLSLATELDGTDWRLVNRQLGRGWVRLTEDELLKVLEAAVRLRVGRDLPLVVPGEVADRLEGAAAEIAAATGRIRLPESFPVIDPAAFPPCMVHLIEQVEAGERVGLSGRYALAAFLTSLGLAPEELNRVVEPPVPEGLTAMATAVAGEEGPTQFPPGTCETMVASGDCVNPDELCETIEHPLQYYDERLAALRS